MAADKSVSKSWLGILITAVVIVALVGLGLNLIEHQQNPSSTPVSSIPTPTPSSIPTPTFTPTPSTSASAQCTTNNLSLTFSAPSGGGTAGTFYYRLTFTNKGNTSCTLYGFPGVSLLDKTGKVVGEATRQGQADTASSLSPGQAAYASVGFPDTANYSTSACMAVDSLQVYPPNQTTALTIPNIASYNSQYTSSYCGSLSVTAVSGTN